MSALDAKIDDLYRQPLADFTSTRNALAKSLTADEAKRVRALAKPTVVPWAVNQVYWHARPVYDRVMKSGARLREAQIAALKGRPADVRAANDAHRHAIAAAVAAAERLAAPAGSKPGADALARTFETLSLATAPTDPPGRLTEALRPAGFEALAGLTPVAHGAPGGPQRAALQARVSGGPKGTALPKETPRLREAASARQARERAEAVAREAAAAERKREAELKKADAAVARAEANEKLARATWERSHDALLEARQKRDAIKSDQKRDV